MPDPELSYNGFTFDRPTLEDLDGLFAVYSDPAVWRHSPDHRDKTPDDTREALERSLRCWEADGLDYWILHSWDGTVVGSAGPRLMRGYWNLYARLSPATQGQGLASATQRAAIAAAREHTPDLPIVGRLRETNEQSRRLMERAGLEFRMTGRAEDDGADWLIYADRPLTAELRQRFAS